MTTQSTNYDLRIPGPVPLADDVRDSMTQQIIDHRGPQFADMLDRMTINYRECLRTKGDVFFITSSGTGAMEASVVNTLSPGDKVLCLSVGWFGDRFHDIAMAYKLDVDLLRRDEGEVVDPDQLRDKLRAAKGAYKAVLLTHNESSTGVTNPLRELCAAIHDETDALILVDCVSSTGGIELKVDEWGIDVSVSAAQKSFESPAGISMVSISQRAWKAYERSSLPKYYFDIGAYRKYFANFQPPFTPCLTSLFALELVLERISADGVERSVSEHTAVAEEVRTGVRSIGMELFAKNPATASNTLTAVKLPSGVDGKAVVKAARDQHGVVFGGGPGKTAGKIVRIGHMGRVQMDGANQALEVLSKVIEEVAK